MSHLPNPLRAGEALAEAAVRRNGPAHLERGGATSRLLSELAKGASREDAVAAVSKTAKGFTAEIRLAAEHTVDSGLHGEPVFTVPNPVANNPHADLLVIERGRVASSAQVGVGRLPYLKRKALSSKAQQVVVPTEVRGALCAQEHPSCKRVSDRVEHKGLRSRTLSATTSIEDARTLLTSVLDGHHGVSELAKLSIAAGGGLAAAIDWEFSRGRCSDALGSMCSSRGGRGISKRSDEPSTRPADPLCSAASRHGRRKRRKQVPRQWRVQPPRDCHRALRLMLHIRRRAQEVERPLIRPQAREQHHAAPELLVLAIPPPRLALRLRRRLALPVDQLPADGVVAVPGRR